jgi:hypothetical protein
MSKDVEVGMAGSITMSVLFSAVTLLLRSFSKRYTRLQKRGDENQENEL